MTRRVSLLLLLAVLGAACGTARADTPDFTSDLSAAAVARFASTTTAVSEVSSPIALSVPTELDLPDGTYLDLTVAVERPDGFPTIDEMRTLVTAAVRHPRARITSRLRLTAGAEQYVSAGYDPDRLDQRMTITYFDGLVVWEDPNGFKQIFAPELGSFYLDSEGSWQEATDAE